MAGGEGSFNRRLFERERISVEVWKQKEWLCCERVLERGSRKAVFDTETTSDRRYHICIRISYLFMPLCKSTSPDTLTLKRVHTNVYKHPYKEHSNTQTLKHTYTSTYTHTKDNNNMKYSRNKTATKCSNKARDANELNKNICKWTHQHEYMQIRLEWNSDYIRLEAFGSCLD